MAACPTCHCNPVAVRQLLADTRRLLDAIKAQEFRRACEQLAQSLNAVGRPLGEPPWPTPARPA